MTELQVSLKIALANMFVAYYKAHSYHWNVECENFSEMHKFFRKLYEDLHIHVDTLAEQMRVLNAYAPISLGTIVKSTTILEDSRIPTTHLDMISSMIESVQEIQSSLDKTFQLAETNNKHGLVSFITDLMNTLNIHQWQLQAFLK